MDNNTILEFMGDSLTSVGSVDSLAEQTNDIRGLLLEAPDWDGSFAPELVTLLRNHIALRSIIRLSLEIAEREKNKLVVAESLEEIKTLQGTIKGLNTYFETVITIARSAEIPRRQEDEYDA